jgi:hypothetical protein
MELAGLACAQTLIVSHSIPGLPHSLEQPNFKCGYIGSTRGSTFIGTRKWKLKQALRQKRYAPPRVRAYVSSILNHFLNLLAQIVCKHILYKFKIKLCELGVQSN